MDFARNVSKNILVTLSLNVPSPFLHMALIELLNFILPCIWGSEQDWKEMMPSKGFEEAPIWAGVVP